MQKISSEEAVNLIKSCKRGRRFSCSFIKRSNGELRKMVAMYGVRKYVTGVGAPYSFDDNGLLCVYEPGLTNLPPDKRYRTIPINGLVSVKINGVSYEVQKGLKQVKELIDVVNQGQGTIREDKGIRSQDGTGF